MTSFFKLTPCVDLFTYVETFLGTPYWKEVLSRKVLPILDKGWRLVGSGPCPGCYNGCCEYNGWTHEVYEWQSRAQSLIEEKALLEPFAMSAEDNWVDPVLLAYSERLDMGMEDTWKEPAERERIALFRM